MLVGAWLFELGDVLPRRRSACRSPWLALVSISRSYIMRLQDRIILLEMKVRCAEVLPAGQDARLAELVPKQIVALRFASDDELGDAAGASDSREAAATRRSSARSSTGVLIYLRT